MAMSSMIIIEGNMAPNDAAMAPLVPPILYPTYSAQLTAKTPGSDCTTAMDSQNSSCSIQRRLFTTARSIMYSMAQPPPKVKAPMFKNVTKSCQIIFMLEIYSAKIGKRQRTTDNRQRIFLGSEL